MKPLPALHRRTFLKAALGAAGGLLVAGCQSTAGPAATSPSGGQLNYLGWEGYDLPTAGQAWAEAKAVLVNANYVNHNDEVVQRIQASGPGQFDVGTLGSRYLPSLIDQGLIQPVDLTQAPNFADTYPALREAGWAQRDGQQFALPAYFGFDVINYNADQMDKPLRWTALVDPANRGKVGMYDSLGALILIGIELGFGGDAAAYTHAELDQIREWGKQWKANTPGLLATYGEMADRLASGELWLAAPGWEYVTLLGQRQGARLAHTLPDGPAKCWVDSYVVFTDPPHPDIASGWLNNAFAPEVMAQSSQNLSSFVTNPKAIPLMPQAHREGMGYAAVEQELERAVFSFFPPAEQTDSERINLADFQAAWEEIKAA